VDGYCSQSVTQQVWAMILSLTQHLPEYGRLAKDGSLVKNEVSTVLRYPIRELSGPRTRGLRA
jgi:lactate dehydrogenase-like 2-hydroxyacid dehydrogenase